MGVEPTQDGITAPQTVLKTAAVTGPRAAPLRILSRWRRQVTLPGPSLLLGRRPPPAHREPRDDHDGEQDHRRDDGDRKTTGAAGPSVAAAAFGFRFR